MTAIIQSSISPVLGQLSDQRGATTPVVLLLALGATFSIALAVMGETLVYAVLLVAAGCAFGGLYAPAFALIAHGAEDSGLPQGLAFAGMNAAWALGAGGAVAQATGDRVPLLLLAALCAATLVVARSRRPA